MEIRNLYHICVLRNLKVQKLPNLKQVDGASAATKKQRQMAQVGYSHQAGEEGFSWGKMITITVH